MEKVIGWMGEDFAVDAWDEYVKAGEWAQEVECQKTWRRDFRVG